MFEWLRRFTRVPATELPGYADAFPTLQPDPAWMQLAWADVGVKEIGGKDHASKIIDYFRDSGHSWVTDDETAWCAAFVGAQLERAMVRSTRNLGARSYENWGDRLTRPEYGAIGVKKRHGGPAWGGHVGFVVGANDTHVFLLGGNQSNEVNVSAFKRAEFTAFRWPTGYPRSKRPLATDVAGARANVSQA